MPRKASWWGNSDAGDSVVCECSFECKLQRRAICATRARLNERITTESNRKTLWIIVEVKNGECCEKNKWWMRKDENQDQTYLLFLTKNVQGYNLGWWWGRTRYTTDLAIGNLFSSFLFLNIWWCDGVLDGVIVNDWASSQFFEPERSDLYH